MARLEYRMHGGGGHHSLLYSYPSVGREEMAMRFACDYFVKDGVVYERLFAQPDADGGVIYVKEAPGETAFPDGREGPDWAGIRIELRHYREEAIHYPIVRTFEFAEPLEALLYLQSGRLLLDGRQWEKTSAEIDEDRMVYVYYAQEVREHE